MKDYLISMFVDNELDIDEKIEFVENVHGNKPFKDEAVEFLVQEKLLQGGMAVSLPHVSIPMVAEEKVGRFQSWFLPLAGFATAMVLMVGVYLSNPSPVVSPIETQHRFVIYSPDVSKVEIVGDFTRWSPVAMEKIGDSGYWTAQLSLSGGEHRYSYLVDDGRQVADPTVLTYEHDDFGGINSIIRVAGSL